MLGLLAGLAFTVIALLVAVAVIGLFFKIVVKLVLLPLLIIKWVLMGIVMLVVGPILFVIGLAGLLAVSLVMALPLLPFLALGALVWLIVRSNQRPAAA